MSTANFTALNPEVWSRRMGSLQKKALVARAICDLTEGAKLTVGDTVNKPYVSDLSVSTYTPGTDVSLIDMGATNEQLTVTTFETVPFYVDEIDIMQNGYDLMAEQTDRAQYLLNDKIDTAVLARYVDSDNTDITNASIGGAAGAITATSSNIHQIFTALKREMREANVTMTGDTYVVVDPSGAELIEQYVAANGFNTADATIKNGYAGDFLGVQVYVSNNLTTGSNVTHWIGGKKGAISLVVQKEPTVMIKDNPLRAGKNVICLTAYGIKTFKRAAKDLFDINIYSA